MLWGQKHFPVPLCCVKKLKGCEILQKKKEASSNEKDSQYHNTYRLLSHYRDVVWSMELSVDEMQREFQIEYESSIDDFLDSVYMAGADLSGTRLERHARTIERSNEMLKMVQSAVELLRTKHKNGEKYYWVLYYAFLSPQKVEKLAELLDLLRPHIQDISKATYYRIRKEAVNVMSDILWGYSSKNCGDILNSLLPED